MKKIYIAGPMRGIRDFNFPAFHQAAKELCLRGYEVFDPAQRDKDTHGEDVFQSETGDLNDLVDFNFSHRDAMKADTTWICDEADAIAMLPGWEKSSGAFAEWALARCLGLEIVYL